MKIFDIIYCDITESYDLKEAYPNAIITDASDYLVHDCRFSVEVEADEKEYIKTLILNDYADVSMFVTFSKIELIKMIVDEIKKEQNK